MKDRIPWLYNELKHDEVKMNVPGDSASRKMESESDAVLDTLGIEEGDVFVDFGSMTGAFAVQAALRGAKVYAVDASEAMINCAKANAEKAGASNIEFCHEGFLTVEIEDSSVDCIVAAFALHRLPDLWKAIALERMYKMLKPGGQLYFYDAVVEDGNKVENIPALIKKLASGGGDFLKADAEVHFRKEFSTYDWIMDGLLTRAGFIIKCKDIEGGVIGTYYCLKPLEGG